MTYAQYGKIQAADYNAFVGETNSTTANQLNAVYGVGNGSSGYGQTTISKVVIGDTVTYNKWQSLINTYASIGNHQSTAITAVTMPSQGARIEALAPISTNLASIYTNRLNAAAQSATASTTVTNSSTWSSAITFTHTVTFASADSARYFFNAGGQLAMTFSHPTGTGINDLWNKLTTACGTVVLSAPSAGTAIIAGTTYSGVTKIGGSGTETISSTIGYFGLTDTYAQIFNQVSSVGPAGYTGSFVTVEVKSNGVNLGGNGDAGSVIYIRITFDEVPNGAPTYIAAAGSATTVTVRPPSTSYLTNTWGTVSVSGTVTGT